MSSTTTHDAAKADLRSIADDRATIARERNLLDRWEATLDREERVLRRAIELVDDQGQTRLVDADGRAYKPQSKPQQRDQVLGAFQQGVDGGPLHDQLSQVELQRKTGLDSGALSRAVRDLEVMGPLVRVGATARRSPLWALRELVGGAS